MLYLCIMKNKDWEGIKRVMKFQWKNLKRFPVDTAMILIGLGLSIAWMVSEVNATGFFAALALYGFYTIFRLGDSMDRHQELIDKEK